MPVPTVKIESQSKGKYPKLLINGQPLNGIKKVSVEAEYGKMSTVTVTFYCMFEDEERPLAKLKTMLRRLCKR